MGRNKKVRQKTYDLNEGKSSGLTIFVTWDNFGQNFRIQNKKNKSCAMGRIEHGELANY
jgi:hypothetical protein